MDANFRIFNFILDPRLREENKELTLNDFVAEYDTPQVKAALDNWETVYNEYLRRSEEIHYAEEEREKLMKGRKPEEYTSDKRYQAVKSEIEKLETAYGEAYPEKYAALLHENQPEQLQNVIDTYQQIKNMPEKRESFRFLASFREQISADWLEKDGQNVCRLNVQPGKDGSNSIVIMKFKNLGGTGLNFSIEDGRSIVFAPDSKLTHKQVSTMSRFFADQGMKIEDFSKLKDIKVYDDRDGQTEVGNFEDIFKQETDNLHAEKSRADNIEKQIKNGEDTDNALPVTDENTTEAAVSGASSEAGEDKQEESKVGFESYLNDEAKPRTYRDMKKAVRARAGIMRISPRCIVEKRMPDGSVVISLYGSEADKAADGKMNKDGVVQHKKKVAFRMWKNPPRVSIYVPDGAEFKAAYAKGALKAGNQPYFYMPPTNEFGGDAQKAFWEAAGDTLTCPLLKSKDHPDGCDIGNDHMQVILKAIKDKSADDEKEVLKFKMRLIGQLQKYKEYKGSLPSELDDTCHVLEGDIRFHFFQSSVLADLNKSISIGVAEKGWDAIDVACAYKAMGSITKMVNSGRLTYSDEQGKKVTVNYDYLHPENNKQVINKIFAEKMGETRPAIEQEFRKELRPGTEEYNSENQEDEYEDNSDKRLQQKDFDKVSRELVSKYHDRLTKEGGVFATVSAQYPGSEKCQKWNAFRPSATPAVKINLDKTEDDNGKPKLIHPLHNLNHKGNPDLSQVTTGSIRNEAGKEVSIGGEDYYKRGRNSAQAALIQRANATASRGGK